jgi:hypothetical protein
MVPEALLLMYVMAAGNKTVSKKVQTHPERQ